MDLMQENPIKENKVSKFKLSFIIVIVLIIILIIAAVCIYFYTQKLKAELFKVNIDGIASTRASNEEGLFLIENGKVYTSISGICPYVSYNYYRGGYGQFSEDRTKCYVNNSKEIVTFSSGSNEIMKYPSSGEQAQTFEIDEDVILRGETLYVSEEGLERAFNLVIRYYSENNTVNISTLPYLTAYYERIILNASLEKSGFNELVNFNNEKALLDNFVVIKDEDTNLYGVAQLSTTGQTSTLITPRYTQVEYMEGTRDFVVTTEERKVGIIGSDGMTKVKPDYDSINIIDRNAGLYLVANNNKQGVINSNGKIIIHQDYDSIGLDQGSYDDPNVTNRYLLFDNCIPVKLNDKWGLIDVNGEIIAQVEYDGIGCKNVGNTGVKNSYGSVVIPDIKGIVVKINNIGEDGKTIIEKYGIISSSGEPMIKMELDNAYMTTVADVNTYYVTFQNQSIDIVNWWYEQVAKQTGNLSNNNESEEQVNTINQEDEDQNQTQTQNQNDNENNDNNV